MNKLLPGRYARWWKQGLPVFAALLTATVVATFAATLAGCGNKQDQPQAYQGYIEGEYLYLASPQAGYLRTLDVPRGQRVNAAQQVFALASDPDTQALAEAEARVGSAQEKVQNLREPHRPTEVAALEANVRQAEAALRLAQQQLQRQQALHLKGFVSDAAVDDARSTRDQASATLDNARQQLATFRTTLGRQPEVRGAEADVNAAAAQAAQKRWVVERMTVSAPATGEINETYYRPGEWVAAGAPVASLLPDERRRVRFFVPETVVATIRPGTTIEARCDGCAAPIRAKVDFVAPQSEYTPPVIYSRGAREKLVFRVEAVPAPEQAAKLRPGLPVDVRIVP